MKAYFLPCLFSILVSISCIDSQKSNEIFVSPEGSDLNEGSAMNPFKTIQKAYRVICEREFGSEDSLTVYLNDGVYRIDQPIAFSGEFGHEDVILKIKAIKDASPIISGGVELLEWKKNGNGMWVARVPDGISDFRELFIDGERAIRARHPNKVYLNVKEVGEDKRTNFTYHKSDFPLPKNVDEVELALIHDWSMTRININSIDVRNQRIYAVDSIGAKCLEFFKLDHWEAHPRYFLENAPEFLDADNEWYFNKEERKVYLKLEFGKSAENMLIEIPVANQLVVIKGSHDKKASNISFEGITFKHCAWEIPSMGYGGIQACHFDPRPNDKGWGVVPAAIHTTWAENISFTECTFKELGGSGVWFDTGSKDCRLNSCRLVDISGNGIMIGEGQHRLVNGEPWWKAAPEQVATANEIENCHVSDCGKQFYGAVGIWCGLTAETKIRNNELNNLPYSGISIGWMWNPEPTPCRNNEIVGNHIHHILQTLSDGGGIYMLGLQPGSKLLNNHIHDVQINAGRAESNGMFLDEGTKDVLVENNLIYNIAKSPLRFHKGDTNVVKGNYLFCGNGIPPIRYNNTKEEDIQKIDNIVFTEGSKDYETELKQAISKFQE